MAFNFSAGTTALGINQLTEAFSSNSTKNDFLHEASNLPGLIAFGTNSKNAEAIDVFSGMLPEVFMSGNGTSLFFCIKFCKKWLWSD